MSTKKSPTGSASAQPHLHQREIQAYGTVNHALPLDLEEPVRLEITEELNKLLADTMTIRDLYKKSHWQVAGPTFYQLHMLFDKLWSWSAIRPEEAKWRTTSAAMARSASPRSFLLEPFRR
jgi:ferritin-like protein